MRLGSASLAALARAEKADNEYRDAKVRIEIEIRAQLEEKLKALEWERARAVRDADTTIIQETGRSNIAALNRAIHSKDHATVKAILALTESIKEKVTGIHPDDSLISLDALDPERYHFIGASGMGYSFKVVRGEYVGVSPTEADELDAENAIPRIAEWEARRNG